MGPLIPISKVLEIEQTSALYFTGFISLLIFLNYLYKLFPNIEDVDRKSYGTLFYCVSLFILIKLFWDKDPTSLMAGIFIMTFGDGLAGLIGKNFTSRGWLFFHQKKSINGTFTMYVTSLIVVLCLGHFQEYDLNINFFIIAFLVTALEQFSIIGIDNLIVPIAGAISFNLLITHL